MRSNTPIETSGIAETEIKEWQHGVAACIEQFCRANPALEPVLRKYRVPLTKLLM